MPIAHAMALLLAAASSTSAEPPRAVGSRELCATRGSVEPAPDGGVRIRGPKVRAVLPARPARDVEMRFTYLGPAKREARLGSGELRRQLGLKLRAQDSCNVVYVMWRIAPESKLVVQVKRNAGKRTHAECGTAGYRTIRPSRSRPVPPLVAGESHRLRAAMEGDALRVEVDGKPVWEGRLGPEVLEFDGPVGIRTDNVEVDLALSVQPDPKGAPIEPPGRCAKGDPGDD